MSKKKYDFGGYATKSGVKCKDGRTIMNDAFEKNDGDRVPLVWQHLHDSPDNVLGHAILENRKDGVYAYCSFNSTKKGLSAKELVKHGDVDSLSIFANELIEQKNNVIHGSIKEVSLVLAGANPQAKIDYLTIQHGDGTLQESDDEAIIQLRIPFEDESPNDDNDPEDDEVIKHADSKKTKNDDATIADVIETMDEQQKNVMYSLVAQALETGEGENNKGDNKIKHSNLKGDEGMRNVFDQTQTKETKGGTLSHDAIKVIMNDAKQMGSLKESFLKHAATYGIDPIDYLFPDAKNISNTPAMLKRDTEWVKEVFNAASHTPFSRIKTIIADITADEARARGYIKGNLKKDEVITLLKRVTNPTTIYKKQKLDRDDIVDITDFEVVAWLKGEMRLMLEEEAARAQLVGDGRSTASDDKIKEDCIRPIYSDHELYAPRYLLDEESTILQTIDKIVMARKDYKGSGNPVFFSTPDMVAEMLLLRDKQDRRLYNTINDLAAALRVSKIVEVPVMEGLFREIDSTTVADLLGIVVNMKDYSLGADKGGAISMFDDFDIDYNQFKYLIETRLSGALTVPKSALIIEKKRTVEESEG